MKEYLWMLVDDGHYVLEYVENTKTRIIRHELNYPINENKNGWCFFTGKYMDGEAFKREEWDLTDEEQEEIKNYIRNVLKPSDLYEESEGKKMEDMKILNVAVPSDLADEVMSIVARFEGVPVSDSINFSAEQELEVCKADKENLLIELQTNKETITRLNDKFDNARALIETMVAYQKNNLNKEDFANWFKIFSDAQIELYGLQAYREVKYKVTRVKATKTIEADILVLEIDDDVADAENVLDWADKSQVDGYFEEGDASYDFKEMVVRDDDLTKEDVLNRYSQESVFYADDCEDIWN